MTPTSFSDDPFVTIARVFKTQGRFGEVACRVHSDFPEKFAEREAVLLLNAADGVRRDARIERHWFHKGFVILKFTGIDSITDAEKLIGMQIQIPEAERAPLETGAYYISDLVGCVLLDKGVSLGAIRAVNTASAGVPLLVLESDLEVPFAESYLECVDLAGKQVRMNLPEGLLEINS